MMMCWRAAALFCAGLLAVGVTAYTVDCNHEYTDCDTELSKIAEDDELPPTINTSPPLKSTHSQITDSTYHTTTPQPTTNPSSTTPRTTETTEPPTERIDVPEELKPQPRLINLNVDELQNFANALHNQSDKTIKKLADLSDVTLDDDDEEPPRTAENHQHTKDITDKFYSNLQAPFHALMSGKGESSEIEMCKENEVGYKIGEKIDRGCEETCECTAGGIFECSPRCKHPYIRRGRRLNDPLCFESPVDACCSIIACATGNGDAKITKLEMCKYNNQTYAVGTRWNIGCESSCSCEANSVVTCKPRCKPLSLSDKCINVQDPNDACCEVQVCDVSQDVHELTDNATTSTTSTPHRLQEDDEDEDTGSMRRPLVLAEPIGSIKVLQNNSVQVNLIHPNNTEDPIRLLLSDDAGKTFQDVELKYSNLILNLEGGRDYIVKTKETGTKFNFTITASEGLARANDAGELGNASKAGCWEDGKFYEVGEEFKIGCTSLCECTGSETRECVAIVCPNHVGLEIMSKGCVKWAPSPPALPPNCCPRSARCLSDGTCHYNGVPVPNWSEVPIALTGCEQRCFCENGDLDCQEVCSPLPPIPPQTLRCPPMHRPAAVNISDDDCCKQWGCVPLGRNGSQTYSMPEYGEATNYVTPISPILPSATTQVLPEPPETTDSMINFYKHLNPFQSHLKYLKSMMTPSVIHYTDQFENNRFDDNSTMYSVGDTDSYKNTQVNSFTRGEDNFPHLLGPAKIVLNPYTKSPTAKTTVSSSKPIEINHPGHNFTIFAINKEVHPLKSAQTESHTEPGISYWPNPRIPKDKNESDQHLKVQTIDTSDSTNYTENYHTESNIAVFSMDNAEFPPQNIQQESPSVDGYWPYPLKTKPQENTNSYAKIHTSAVSVFSNITEDYPVNNITLLSFGDVSSSTKTESPVVRGTNNWSHRINPVMKDISHYIPKTHMSVSQTVHSHPDRRINFVMTDDKMRDYILSPPRLDQFYDHRDHNKPIHNSLAIVKNLPLRSPNGDPNYFTPIHQKISPLLSSNDDYRPKIIPPDELVTPTSKYFFEPIINNRSDYIIFKSEPGSNTFPNVNPSDHSSDSSSGKRVTVLKTKVVKSSKPSDAYNTFWVPDAKTHVLTKQPNPYETVLLRAIETPMRVKTLKPNQKLNSLHVSTKTYSTMDLENLLNQMEVQSEVNKNLGRSADKNQGPMAGHTPQIPPEFPIHKPQQPSFLPTPPHDNPYSHKDEFDQTNIHQPPPQEQPGLPDLPMLQGPSSFGDMNRKLSVISIESDSTSSIKMLLGLPPVLVGLRGSVDLRYTDKDDEDVSHWYSQVFAPADEVLTTPRLEFRLTGLKPGTMYKIRGKLFLHNLPVSPESDTYSVRTQDLPTVGPVEEKRREISSGLTVVEANDTTAHVSWKHFTEDELQFIDGIQVRYRPVGTPIYSMTEVLHHSRSAATLVELRPGSRYEASLVLIPPPRASTELHDPHAVHFTTAPHIDPYNWTVVIEVRSVGAEAAELTWHGIPSPAERWVRVYRAAHACGDQPGKEHDEFRLAARDQPPSVTLSGLVPDTRCRVWLELFLTNGKVKTSNVLEINTKSLDADNPIDNEIEASGQSARGRPRGDYYTALVGVGVVAALGALTSLLLLLVVVRRHRPRSVSITPAPSAPRESSLPPYDNPAYKLELQQETMDL